VISDPITFNCRTNAIKPSQFSVVN
jgi:hypothetical protein